MLRFKDSVRLGVYFTSQIGFALTIVDQVYESVGKPECWVTSIHDGVHKLESKHYVGRAADIRTKDLTEEQRGAIHTRLELRLRPLGFDVLLEDKGGPNEHFHIEWDPK